MDESDVGLSFFPGHGIQVKGENFLGAVDTNIAGDVRDTRPVVAQQVNDLSKQLEQQIAEKRSEELKVLVDGFAKKLEAPLDSMLRKVPRP